MTAKNPDLKQANPTESDRGIASRGFRLPATTRLGRVRLQVTDLTRSLAYYEQIIGLRVLERAVGTATLGPQLEDRPLVELRERGGGSPAPRRGRLGLYHFAILLPDRPALGRFAQHLADIGVHAGMSAHLVSEALYLTDPDGLGIEVYADRPRSTWRYEGRQLVMTTAPLDIDDLIHAANSKHWSGIPADTAIGHVHLFVGDLATAAAFYHTGLGFDKVVWNYPGALFLSAGGYHHHLSVNTWAAGAAPAGENDPQLLEWEILLPSTADVTAALGSLTKIGAAVEPSAEGEGVIRDAWGTTVRLRATGVRQR